MKNAKLKIYLIMVISVITISSVFSQTPTPDIFSPTFSHLSGRYNHDIKVQLTSKTLNSKIYFTLDGTDPDTSSQQYMDSILIAGDGNYVTLKAITISQDTLKSLISSAIYIIDFSFNVNSNYLTNLTWSEYNNFIVGDWFGYTTNPWTDNYCVKLSILPNGNYIDTTTSGCGLFTYNDVFEPVFYYGTSNTSLLKNISIYNILPSGYANGFITIDFGLNSTNQDELRYIKFIDNRNLYIEMWHDHSYGPLKYYLTKNSPLLPAGLIENKLEKSFVYPNPASDYIHIENLNSSVEFINQLGQTFLIDKNEKISISHLPKGLYLLSFKNKEGFIVRQKLMIN